MKINLLTGLGIVLVAAWILALGQEVVPSALAASSEGTTENSWMSKSSMNMARAYLGVAVVNGKIYAIGGDTDFISGSVYPGISRGLSVVNTTEEYAPATNNWTMKTPMLTARAQFGIAVYQNRIYCIGGYFSNYNDTDANEMYDPVTDSWTTKKPMPSTAVGIQANTVDGKIYVTGSHPNMNYDYAPVNYVYDPITDSWASRTPPPNAIADRYSAVVGSKIYFIGAGRDLGNVVQAYDTLNDSWSVLAPSPAYPESENGGGVTSGLYAPKQFCFFDEKATYVFNLANNSWAVGEQMPVALICAGVTVVNDTFYVVGGRSGPHDIITIMDPSALTEQYLPFGYGTDQQELPAVCLPEPFIATIIVASVVTVAVIGVSLLVYFKKRSKLRNS
jgi:N-acetylneuraminic acid mutarotase